MRTRRRTRREYARATAVIEMNNLNEQEVSDCLTTYFQNRGLTPLGKKKPFEHADDVDERSFEIDLAIGPTGTLGNRNQDQINRDRITFENASDTIDPIVEDLRQVSLFPKNRNSIMSWCWKPNPNPVYGIAIEIENNLSKYLLGSLLASAIAGRWGLLILPDTLLVPRWIETLNRMMHKGEVSPIPSNISVFSWPDLLEKLRNG